MRLTATPRTGSCDQCGRTALTTLGNQELCLGHYSKIVGPIRERIVDQVGSVGVGALHGALRSEYGPLVGDVRCTTCSATWTGLVGDACGWCQTAHQLGIEHQADILLRGPDVDPADRRHAGSIAAWSERLARGVEAGIITAEQADRARNRGARHAA